MSADGYAVNDKGDAYVNLEAHDDTDAGSINNIAADVPGQVKSLFTRQLMAEFFGTFIMVSFGLGATAQITLSSGTAGTFITVAITWGVAYFLGISVAGGVSGGHLNPTVTVAVAALGMLPWKKVPFYFLVQLLASYIAALVVYILYRPMLNILTMATKHKCNENVLWGLVEPFVKKNLNVCYIALLRDKENIIKFRLDPVEIKKKEVVKNVDLFVAHFEEEKQ
eukprot:jgi/Phyca11/536228/estExt2_fgenesh1_pg.C_PHYCAscaffold_490043